jgi:4'-phosphopantetheinyl transferase
LTPAEVWYVRTADVAGDALLGACGAILTPEERERGRAFLFERNRHEHLVTRALGRLVLGRALGVDPSSLSFRRTVHGRPELDPPSELRFNLTNTTAFVACVLARGREVGLDAEPATRAPEILDVAHVVFTKAEREGLAGLETDSRRLRALRLWTAKEAYMKARGLGFSLAPTRFELSVREDGVSLRYLEDLGDDASRWEITTREIEGHMVAVCVERRGASGSGSEIVFHRADLAALLAMTARASARGKG